MNKTQIALVQLETLYDACSDMHEQLVNSLKKFIEFYSQEINIEHPCGISHYITDFSDTDECGIAKHKELVSVYYDKDADAVTAKCADGKETTDFVFEDVLYLLDDIVSNQELSNDIFNDNLS